MATNDRLTVNPDRGLKTCEKRTSQGRSHAIYPLLLQQISREAFFGMLPVCPPRITRCRRPSEITAMSTNDPSKKDRSLLWSGLGFTGVVLLIAILSTLGVV
jgi:hypothetical protein